MNTFTKTLFLAAAVLSAPSLASAQACPSFENSGAPLAYTSDEVYTAQGHTVIAGGDLNLAACSSVPGVGSIVATPDFTLQYDAQDRGRALEFRVSGTCDTVLLINTATAEWVFNDDDTDANPRLRIENAPSGQYDIWVGTYEAEMCEASLIVESW